MIDLNKLIVEIADKRIIDDVSLSIKKGEFVGLLGPNGSGKSTMLKTIYRYIKAKSGRVSVCDKNIYDISIKESARNLSVVSQQHYYNFEFSVEDVVVMGRSPHKELMALEDDDDMKIVDHAINIVGLDGMRDRRFSTLSGGEQQRVILARAIAQDTPCLIMDEPTNNLDIKYQLQLMDIVKDLDITTFCALHDLNIAAMYCDRIFLIDEGKIYSSGTPEEVLTEDNIKKVYGIKSKIHIDPDTHMMNIVYYSDHFVDKHEASR